MKQTRTQNQLYPTGTLAKQIEHYGARASNIW